MTMCARLVVLLVAVALSTPAETSEVRKRPRGEWKTAIDRWNGMSAGERERALEKLPPERRKRLQAQMERYNGLSAEERSRFRRRYDQFQQMAPEKQERAREVFREMSQLSPERRRTLRGEIESLRPLSESERSARLESEDFKSRYSETEQKLIRHLSGLALR